jgi:nitrile hydratase
MAKVHDRGGRLDAGPINRAEHVYTFWEKKADAIAQLMGQKKLRRVDEMRRTLEAMEPDQYERLSYYDRWLVATESLLVEKGMLTSMEIDERLQASPLPPRGERARVREPGHDGHDHEHLPGDDRLELSPSEQRLDAIAEVLIDMGVLTAGEIRRQMEDMDSHTPAQGAPVVARAWVDPDFKRRLLTDAKAACAELGVDASSIAELVALENTDKVHHMVVCTLCSCYPRPVLGLPPDWYKSLAYRSRAVVEPRSVLHEFGLDLPDNVEVRVVDSTADTRFLVLPARPAGTEGMSERELAELVTRDCMIGTAVPRAVPLPQAGEAR